jgi:hypothetical protein
MPTTIVVQLATHFNILVFGGQRIWKKLSFDDAWISWRCTKATRRAALTTTSLHIQLYNQTQSYIYIYIYGLYTVCIIVYFSICYIYNSYCIYIYYHHTYIYIIIIHIYIYIYTYTLRIYIYTQLYIYTYVLLEKYSKWGFGREDHSNLMGNFQSSMLVEVGSMRIGLSCSKKPLGIYRKKHVLSTYQYSLPQSIYTVSYSIYNLFTTNHHFHWLKHHGPCLLFHLSG